MAAAKKNIIKNAAAPAAKEGFIALRHFDPDATITAGGECFKPDEFGIIYVPVDLVVTFSSHGFSTITDQE